MAQSAPLLNPVAHPVAHYDVALMAHLFRRAGFGATYEELEALSANGYEATVECLLRTEDAQEWNDDLVRRYHVGQNSLMLIESSQSYWMYRMINTKRPLEEKSPSFSILFSPPPTAS